MSNTAYPPLFIIHLDCGHDLGLQSPCLELDSFHCPVHKREERIIGFSPVRKYLTENNKMDQQINFIESAKNKERKNEKKSPGSKVQIKDSTNR